MMKRDSVGAGSDADAEAGDRSEEPFGFRVSDKRFWAEGAETEEEEERAQVPSYVEKLQQEVQQKDRQLREYIAAYKKEVVENLEQTKQRLERDAEQRISLLRGELSVPMLEVLEAVERSIQHAESGADAEGLLSGLKMLGKLVAQKIKDLGLARIETVGKPFDPAVHDAVGVVPVTDPQQHNVVSAELAPGFTLDGRVVRPAKVQVGKLQS